MSEPLVTDTEENSLLECGQRLGQHASYSTLQSSENHHVPKTDYVLILLAILIKLGDGVEIYLPGVITQTVSCELGLSEVQEGILAVIFSLSYASTLLFSVFVLKTLGERATLLLSMYLSIVFVIVCAIVPNYYTLLLSRALTGIGVGLNGCTIGIFLAKHSSTKEIVTKGSFLAEGLAMPVGGAIVSILGWFFLDIIDWRIFILITSTPLFIPPIILLHCCFASQTSIHQQPLKEETVSKNDKYSDTADQEVPNFIARVFRSSLFFFCNICVGHGSIILVPWLIRKYKSSSLEDNHVADGECREIVQGTDFLIMSLVTGVTNILGRPLGYFLRSRVRFLILQITVTLIMALGHGFVLFKPNLAICMICIGLSKLCYSIQAVEVAILNYDYGYFGKAKFELGSCITIAFGLVGAVVGISLCAFLEPTQP